MISGLWGSGSCRWTGRKLSSSEEIEDVVSTLLDEEELGQYCIGGTGPSSDESMAPVEICFVMMTEVVQIAATIADHTRKSSGFYRKYPYTPV